MKYIEQFLRDTLDEAKEYQKNTRDCIVETEITASSEDEENDFVEPLEQYEQYEPVEVQHKNCHNKTTMFLNKYAEDTEIQSIANKLADAIVHFEITNCVPINDVDDFLIDDENATEEEFEQNNVDEGEYRNYDTEVSNNVNIPLDDVRDKVDTDLDSFYQPSEDGIKSLSIKAKNLAKRVQEKVCVAPGEHGSFKNWGEDVYIEEKSFPHLFPYGVGGYLSSCIDNPDDSIGFAEYCKSQLMSCDDKFRKDESYIFFILLVKELILLKRCISTFFRQATRLSNLTRDDVLNADQSDLTRFNRSYSVFKNIRGTSSYYEEAKKNLFAILRQHGCPTFFLTLNSNEFDWPGLLKSILETELRREVSEEEIESLSNTEKNKIISRNYVESTLHFQKRIEKMFSLMEKDFFVTDEHTYHVYLYFYRIEYQARGSPHVHSLIWLRDEKDQDAPSFWVKESSDISTENTERKHKVEKFADEFMTTSPDDITCTDHQDDIEGSLTCAECHDLLERVKKYQLHNHTFTCEKKMKAMTIKAEEGHGRLDGIVTKEALENLKICRFRFPRFPLDETMIIQGISKDEDEKVVLQRKKDLRKITTYMIRQTYEKQLKYEEFEKFMEMDFVTFLFEVGMFIGNKKLEEYNEDDIKAAKLRYINAISASVKGTAMLVLKREVKNIFINAYNPKIMRLHKTNHDVQLCIDPYGCAQYCCCYLTKNEAGSSTLLKAVNDETNNLSQLEKLRALAAVLDKHRECSIQEAVYRLLGLNMVKSSVKVKYLSTIHPNFRDGLLKGHLETLEPDESIFHSSPHDYYEMRPLNSENENIKYDEEEMDDEYWDLLTLSEFWSKYEIVYNKLSVPKEGKKSTLIPLQNGKGFIRRRRQPAILRYYLNFGNDEDLARGLLILFKPFRSEMNDIHRHDVKVLLNENNSLISEKRAKFEKYQTMLDLISSIQSKIDQEDDTEDIENEENLEVESTDIEDIESFNKWAKSCASKDLAKFKNLISVSDLDEFRKNISSLTKQQRRLFDDFVERMVSPDIEERPIYLFISGNAGTGKSYLVSLMIEAVKLLNIKAGSDLQKPSVLSMAPTANAAFIIGGKTIDSALGFIPSERNRYTQSDSNRMAMMKFQYEDVKAIFVDEVSMLGSTKLSKINYRLQDLADGSRKHKFMGGVTFIVSGDLWQLPPIMDNLVTDKNNIDGRPSCAPSHWNENFKVFYLTEKMRSAQDPEFSNLCDRVGRDKITDEDEKWLKSRIIPCESENSNENFKTGKLSIIVTTNKKRNLINKEKLDLLLPNMTSYVCNSIDRVTNLPGNLKLPKSVKNNPSKTANLETELVLKVGAPVTLTINHSKQKYREDGITNGARGYVQSIQLSKEDSKLVDIVWIVLNREEAGRLYRFEHNYLRKEHNPGHELAIPIFPERKTFTLGNVEYMRQAFPLSLSYAITAHKVRIFSIYRLH